MYACIDQSFLLFWTGMDQDKTDLPNFGSGEQPETLPVRVIGAICHGYTKDVRIYTVTHYTKETNTLIEVLTRVLASRSHLPPTLILQLDNTSQENKNNHLFAFLALLLETRVFENIIVNFLPVGHTHEVLCC